MFQQGVGDMATRRHPYTPTGVGGVQAIRCGILARMLEATVSGLLILFPLIGVLARRWFAVAPPLVAWPIFDAGLNKGWWLYGTGDGWEYVALSMTVFGVASTALAVGIARTLKPPPKTHRLRFAKPS